MTTRDNSPTPQKGWYSERNYEALPDCFWEHICRRVLTLRHPLPYIFLRYAWRPRHWDPLASGKGQVEPFRLPVAPFRELLYLPDGDYRRLYLSLGQANGKAGNPLASFLGRPGQSEQTVQLHSIYYKGRLLDKNGELGFGGWDPAHHGILLPWGNIQKGEVVRYISGPDGSPLLSLDAAGLFMWLLFLADQKGISEGWLEGERGYGVVRQRVSKKRTEVNWSLRINLTNYAAELDMLQRLGWIRPNETPPGKRPSALDCLVTEAPADILELIVLAIAAQRGLPLSRARGLVDEIGEGQIGLVWVLHGLEDLAWQLTPEGEELLRIEIITRRRKATTFEPRSPTEEAILDTIHSMVLAETDHEYLLQEVDRLVSLYGDDRVWDVIWNARRRRQTLTNPVGWILSALKSGADRWHLQPAPFQGIDLRDYGPGGKYGHLTSPPGEGPDDDPCWDCDPL